MHEDACDNLLGDLSRLDSLVGFIATTLDSFRQDENYSKVK